MSKLLGLGLGLVLMVGSATTTSAAVITWHSSVDLLAGGNNQNFVNTDGTLVLAFNGTGEGATANTDPSVNGTTSTTVNGVAFQNVNVFNLNNGAVTGVGGVGVSSTYLDTRNDSNAFQDGGFSGDGDIFNLVAGAVFGGGTGAPAAPSVTFSGLTVGQQYQIQVFVNDARTNGTRDSDWQVGFSDGVNNDIGGGNDTRVAFANLNNRDPVTLSGETSGDFIIGTFAADSANQTFALSGTRDGFDTFSVGQAQINALQLRAVPEPSSFALLGGALACFTIRRRRA